MMRCLLLTMCLAASVAGCQKRLARPESAFGADDGEFVLTIAIDMSSSFQPMMADDGRAWAFVCQVVDKYFRDRIGRNDKLILAQLSASDKAVLWRGTPLQLRQEFASGAAFRDWLVSRADPNGSFLYEGILQAAEYTLADPIVASGRGKSAVFVLSDMADNSENSGKKRQQAVDALAEVGKNRGIVGLYFVDVRLCPTWQRLLRDAGLDATQAHVEAEVVGQPLLPSFH